MSRWKRTWTVLAACVAGALVIGGLAWLAEYRQTSLARLHLTTDPAELPAVEVAMVLGTGPLTYWRDGRVTPNLTFVLRLDAAAGLWRTGKVRYFLASGRRDGDYDEPTALRQGLIERGVPSAAIYRDFGGHRTRDSVLRARSVYGLKRMVIVSQKAHAERALFIAYAAGIDAWGLVARDERQSGPDWMERITLAEAALLARWDVMVGVSAREGDSPVAIGVDPPD